MKKEKEGQSETFVLTSLKYCMCFNEMYVFVQCPHSRKWNKIDKSWLGHDTGRF